MRSNRFKNGFGISHYLLVPEPNNAHVSLSQIHSALLIMGVPFVAAMIHSIDLDSQSFCWTIKVENIALNVVLSAELAPMQLTLS